MPDRTVTFSELSAENVLEIGAGRPRSVELDRHPLPILRVADVLDGRIESPIKGYERGTHQQTMGPKVSRPGDIVLTTKGTVGRVAMMPLEGPRFAYSPQLCYFRPIANGPLRPRYLYYWFKSTEFWNQADALKGQTDMADFLSLSDIHLLKIRLPSRNQQDGLVSILGALDDKISSNERISRKVDRLVDTKFERLLADNQSLTKVTLGDIAAINQCSIRPSFGKLRYVDISRVSVGSYEWPEMIDWTDAPGRARRKAKFGDTIWSTVRPNRRSHALVLETDPTLVFSTGLVVLSPTRVGPAFLYESTRTTEFQTYLENVAEGSAYPAVRAERFSSAPVLLPPGGAREAFEEFAMGLRRRARQAARESRVLVALRDALLPELMSGRMRVRDAEKVVEEAT